MKRVLVCTVRKLSKRRVLLKFAVHKKLCNFFFATRDVFNFCLVTRAKFCLLC